MKDFQWFTKPSTGTVTRVNQALARPTSGQWCQLHWEWKWKLNTLLLKCWRQFRYLLGPFSNHNWSPKSKSQAIKTKSESQGTKNWVAQGSYSYCPRPPLPPASSPGSFWRPLVGTTLTTGCWWNSALLFISSALDLLILTPSFTCRTKHEWKFPTTSMDSIHLPKIEHKCDPSVYTRIPVQDALAMKRKRLCRGSDGAAPLWQDTLMESIS